MKCNALKIHIFLYIQTEHNKLGLVLFSENTKMAQIEPMDIDSINSEFDNKENSLHHNNVLPRSTCTEKGYEELDVSEMNMKLRYSITPASSPMSKSLTVNSLDNRSFDNEDFINNVVINENCNLTRSLNSTITRNDTTKSLKSLPLQVLSTELVTENRSASVLRTIDQTFKVQDNNVTITLSGDNFVDDNISLPSTSSSVAQTPEATTPTKEIQKHDGGSPIMRGLKSVLNMFRSSQSPIPCPSPADVIVKREILSPNETVSNIEEHKSELVTASTPISNKRKEASGSHRSSPLKESIVFNDDLERELQWKDETTILFKEEKIPTHKLLLPQSLSSLSKISETASMSSKVEKENLNLSVEPMDISNNDSILDVEVAKHLQPGVITNDLIVESDGEFVDCETTVNNDISDNKIIENLLCMDNQNSTLQQSYNNQLISNKPSINSIQCNTSVTFIKDSDLSTNYNKNGTNISKEQCYDQERQIDALIKDHDSMPIAAKVLLIGNQNEILSQNIDPKNNAPYLRELNEIDIKSSDGPNDIDAKNITHTGKNIKSEETVTDLKLPSDIPLPDEDDVENTLNVENNNTFNISNSILQNNTENISMVEHEINETTEHHMNKGIEFNERSIINDSYLQSINKESKNLKSLDYSITSETKVAATSQVVNEETMENINVVESFHVQDINTKDTVGIIESPDNQKQLIENTYMSETNNVTLTTERNLETDGKIITDSSEIINAFNMKAVFISNKFEGREEMSLNIDDNLMSNQKNDQSIVTEYGNEIAVKKEGNAINLENLVENDKTVSFPTIDSSQMFDSINCIIYPQNEGKNITTTIDTSTFKENDDKIFNINMEDSKKDEDEQNKSLNVLTEKIVSDLQKSYNAMEIVVCNRAEKEIDNDEKKCLINQENKEPKSIVVEVSKTIEENCISTLENQLNAIEPSTNATFNMSIDQEIEIENKETKRKSNECDHGLDIININITDKPNIIIETNNCNIHIASKTTEYTLNQENVFVFNLDVNNCVTSDEMNANPEDNSGESNTVLEHSARQTIDSPLISENNNQVIMLAEQNNSSSEITADYIKSQNNLGSVEANIIKQDCDFVNTSKAVDISTETECEINNHQDVSDITTTVNLASSGDNIEENCTILEHSAGQTTEAPNTLKSDNNNQVILLAEQKNSSSEITADYIKPQINLVSVEADILKQNHNFVNTSKASNFSTETDCEINNYQSVSDITTTVNLAVSGDNIEENNTVLEQTVRHSPCINDDLKSENNTEAIMLPEQINSASENSFDTNQINVDLISVGADIVKQKHDLDDLDKCLNYSKEVDCEVKKDEALSTFQDSSQNQSGNARSRKSSESSERNVDINDGAKMEIESQVSPPLSPVISSKGYNFNLDEINDPFATKTRIRLSPPPEDVPKSSETQINNAISTDMKKDLQNRKSLPAKKRQPLIKNKIRSSFGDAVGYKEIKECKKAAKSVVAADMNNTLINATSDNSLETLPSNSVHKDELIQPIQLMSCHANETYNNINTVEDNKNIIISEDQLKETDTLSHGAEVTSNISRQNIFSEDKYESKNVFNLPEMTADMNFSSFVTKLNVPKSLITDSDICASSFKVPGDLSNCALKSVNCTYSDSNVTEKIDKTYTADKADHDSSTASSSKTTEDATVREVNTEDEDTVEGPFFEANDLNNDDKMPDFDADNEDMMHFTDVLAQGTDDNVDNGEMFIDAEAFEFLLNQNKSNVVVDSGKESLFLKFDPLFANRMSSDGVLAALNKVQRRQSTPKRISRAPTVDVTYCDKMSPVPFNATTDVNNTLENNFEDPNTTVSKPMMVVNPAINSIISPRNKTMTPSPRTNRRSLTFTSPAIAVIDRLLSLNGNNSTLNHEIPTTPVRREPNETDVALTQLRELLAEKEIHVHNLRLEGKELKERLSTLESQVHSLESESEQRLKKIKELNERLVEKTNINKSMVAVVEEYERTIASLIAETEQDKKRHAEERMRLINERDEQTAHLASMEISFNDLHSKYEKSKQIILSFKANEDTYIRSIKEFEGNLLKMQNNYELLKQHATSKLNHANQELEKLNRTHEAEVLKLNAMIKRKDLHITSLEETLTQKTKANEELTAICDELINKVG